MKKKTLTAFTLGAATFVTGMVSNVRADNVKVIKEQIGNETKIVTTEAKTVGTQQQINRTKQQLSNQQAIVNNDKTTINTMQSSIKRDVEDTTNIQNEVNQKKGSLISAQSAVAVAEKENTQTNQDIQLAQNKVNQDKALVSSQQKVVSQAQIRQVDAQQANDQAQKRLSDAKKLNSSAQQKVGTDQNMINSIQQKIMQDNDRINSQQQIINDAQQQVNDDQNKINKNNARLEIDKNKLKNDQQVLEKANQALSNANSVVNDTRQQLSMLQSQSENVVENQIKIPKGYTVELLNQAQEGNQTSANNVQKQTINGVVINLYKHNPVAEKQVVNPNDLTNLPTSDQIELNQFAAKLINSVRSQMGIQPLIVTNGSMKLAQEVADQYNSYNDSKGWNLVDKLEAGQFPHDVQGLQNAVKENDMPLNTPAENAASSIFGESDSQIKAKNQVLGDLDTDGSDPSQWGYWPKYITNGTPLTMDDLEEYVYYSITYMLFSDADSYFGHARNFVEQNGDMGVSFDNLGQVHFEFYPAFAHGDLGTTPIETNSNQNNSQRIKALEKQLSIEQSAVTKAQSSVDVAQQNVSDDQDKIKQDTPTDLQKQITDDQSRLVEDKATLDGYEKQLTNDQQKLKSVQNNLINDKLTVTKAQNILAVTTQEAKTTQLDFNNANNVLTNEQSKLHNLQDQLNSDQAILEKLQQKQKKVTSNLQDVQKILEQSQINYNNAVKMLNDVEAKENRDRNAFDQLQQQYDHDVVVLKNLQTELQNEEKIITTSSTQWVKHPQTTSEIGSHVVLSGTTTKPSVSTTVTHSNASQVTTKPSVSTPVTHSDANKNTGNKYEEKATSKTIKSNGVSVAVTVKGEETKKSTSVYNQPTTVTFGKNKVENDNVSKKSESKNTLPITGETQDKGAAILGAEAISLGLALGGLSFLKRKRKH